MIKKDYPQEPTDEAKVDSSLYDAELIGENLQMKQKWILHYMMQN